MIVPPPQPEIQPQTWYVQVARGVLRWLISTIAIFVAVIIVPGIEFVGPGWELGIVAAVFGLINTLLRPLLTLLTCPLILLTFGLFGLVINAALLLLTAAIASNLGLTFRIDSFWAAVLGGLIVSIISTILNLLAGETPLVIRRETR